MKRIVLAVALAAAVAAIAVVTLRGPTPAPYPKHNVLLISLCSISTTNMGCYGYERDTTPQLDAMIDEAVVFDHAVTQWPKTAPAFASLVTGKYPHTVDVLRITPGRYLADEHVTVGEVFRDGGYATGAFLTSVAIGRKTNIPRGFDVLVESWRSPRRYQVATNRAIEWISESREQPFFAWVHLNSAHYAYVSHAERRDVFIDDEHYDATRKLPPLDTEVPADLLRLPEDYPNRRQILRPDFGTSKRRFGERPDQLDYYIALYDAGIRAADMRIGELLAALAENGQLDDTIIAIVGDHGEALGGHQYYFEHGRLPYDDCARVPMLLRLPRGDHRRRVTEPVPASSLAPTLYELVGLDVPEGTELPSLRPVIEGEPYGQVVFGESGYHPEFMISARDDRWKLIHVPNEWDRVLMQGGEYELYDLVADPGETNDLSAEHPDVVERLAAEIEAFAAPWRDRVYGSEPNEGAEIDEVYRERLRALGYLD